MRFYTFRIIEDLRGNLMAIEGLKDVPFPIARIFYLWGMPQGVKRGGHAHRTLQSVLVCLRGAVDVTLDDGAQKFTCRLDSPGRGLYMGNMMWIDMQNFTADCLIAVFVDACYDESEYIRDYGEFLQKSGTFRGDLAAPSSPLEPHEKFLLPPPVKAGIKK